ncbi:spore coat polysaccharide biosynthesis protein SpsF [Caulobacter ginsengisoli]|uniref:Spore coat polysaccharide biosynthesis protein SpsF n=1 Tax=Caulobacter ginsengisoli TaxID=400775 RepID=A0ABU0IVQ2_9CAUL|nr:NTP transferase domain-containing protein [Caulobacter ginsengisoli]MDQ0466098.1 spore coat polysaccharide biosynthesis protein SpsF [Caulobacter ginsengisoli]
MILAILQARMSSTRLPGKVLMPLAGAPLIVRQIERVSRAGRIDRLVVATSDQPTDDPLEAAVRREGIAVFRGSLDDVQSRFIGALDAFGPADHVVRLTADCPLADWTVIDATIDAFLAADADYGSNTPAHRTYPKGLDVEVMRAEVLRQAAVEARTPEEREHVTWALHRRPDRWRQAFHSQTAEEGEVRWTVDRPDDYAFVAAVYDALYAGNRAFTSQDVRDFVHSRPDLIDYGGDRRV